MDSTLLFTSALGLKAPWQVTEAAFTVRDQFAQPLEDEVHQTVADRFVISSGIIEEAMSRLTGSKVPLWSITA